jgi:hypothetical protein
MRISNLCNLIIIPIFITILLLIGCGEDEITTIVKSTFPEENAVDVPVNSSITVTFSGEINEKTIIPDTFIVADSKGHNIKGTVKYNAATYTATFAPSASFARGTTYAVSINGVKDVKGNDVPPYSLTFTTRKGPTTGAVKGAVVLYDSVTGKLDPNQIRLTLSKGSDYSQVTTPNADGYYLFNNVPAGTSYQLVVGGRSATAVFDVKAGEIAIIDWTIQPIGYMTSPWGITTPINAWQPSNVRYEPLEE